MVVGASFICASGYLWRHRLLLLLQGIVDQVVPRRLVGVNVHGGRRLLLLIAADECCRRYRRLDGQLLLVRAARVGARRLAGAHCARRVLVVILDGTRGDHWQAADVRQAGKMAAVL